MTKQTKYCLGIILYCGALKNKEKETPNEMPLLSQSESILAPYKMIVVLIIHLILNFGRHFHLFNLVNYK